MVVRVELKDLLIVRETADDINIVRSRLVEVEDPFLGGVCDELIKADHVTDQVAVSLGDMVRVLVGGGGDVGEVYKLTFQVDSSQTAVLGVSKTKQVVGSVFGAVVLDQSVLVLQLAIWHHRPELDCVVRRAGGQRGVVDPTSVVDAHLMGGIRL